jgi:hypothetical protein
MTTIFFRCACRTMMAVAVALYAATAALGQGPTLAEIARKEQERRKTQKPPTKVYTNKDLPATAQGRPPTPPTAPAAEEAKATEKPAPPQEGDQKDEAWWRNRINQAREELRRNEMFAEALQTRINSLSADFVSRDDPAQRGQIEQDRIKALAELARVRSDIDRGKKNIEDIEEEARKASVPPGWLR